MFLVNRSSATPISAASPLILPSQYNIKYPLPSLEPLIAFLGSEKKKAEVRYWETSWQSHHDTFYSYTSYRPAGL
jgi:hypothetical protein